MKIGLFDSGIGGITIAKKVLRYLPQYNYVYFADDKHMPYGEKDPEQVYRFTVDSLRVLFEQGCGLVILACNTATTILPRIQQEWLPSEYPDRKVLGVIRPTVEHMLCLDEASTNIFLLATPRTVTSRAYDHELLKIRSTCNIQEIPCPGLAAAIEHSDNVQTDPRVFTLCEKFVQDIPDTSNVVIYAACTHYAFAKRILRKLRPHAQVVNQSSIVSKSLSRYLENHSSVNNLLTKTKRGSIQLLSSSNSPQYIHKLEKLLEV